MSLVYRRWAIAMEVYARSTPAVQARLSLHWKDELHNSQGVENVLHIILHTLSAHMASSDASSNVEGSVISPVHHRTVARLCEAHAFSEVKSTPSIVETTACLYLHLLHEQPSLIRHWWSHSLSGRGAGGSLARFTELHCSPILLRAEVDAIANTIGVLQDTGTTPLHDRALACKVCAQA